MGRYRAVEGAESIWGSTSLGKTATKYRAWAVPALMTTANNFKVLAQRAAKGQFAKKEAQELFRVATVTLAAYLTVSALVEKTDEKSFLGKTLQKAQRETTSIIAAITPQTWLNSARLISFLSDLSSSVTSMMKLEKYKVDTDDNKKGDLKGWQKLKRTVTPTLVSQVTSMFEREKKKPLKIPGAGSSLDKPIRLGF